jgi:hypothetical protein
MDADPTAAPSILATRQNEVMSDSFWGIHLPILQGSFQLSRVNTQVGWDRGGGRGEINGGGCGAFRGTIWVWGEGEDAGLNHKAAQATHK